jgi:hypothetical protein
VCAVVVGGGEQLNACRRFNLEKFVSEYTQGLIIVPSAESAYCGVVDDETAVVTGKRFRGVGKASVATLRGAAEEQSSAARTDGERVGKDCAAQTLRKARHQTSREIYQGVIFPHRSTRPVTVGALSYCGCQKTSELQVATYKSLIFCEDVGVNQVLRRCWQKEHKTPLKMRARSNRR